MLTALRSLSGGPVQPMNPRVKASAQPFVEELRPRLGRQMLSIHLSRNSGGPIRERIGRPAAEPADRYGEGSYGEVG